MKKALNGLKGLVVQHKVLVGIVAIVAAVSFTDGNTCLFKLFSGVPCPGCGMTRAYIRLAHFKISAAFFFHPLFIIPPVIAIIILFKDKGFISKIYRSNTFWLVLLMMIMGAWAIRMLFLFPHTLPMDYYKGSLVGKILASIKDMF